MQTQTECNTVKVYWNKRNTVVNGTLDLICFRNRLGIVSRRTTSSIENMEKKNAVYITEDGFHLFLDCSAYLHLRMTLRKHAYANM